MQVYNVVKFRVKPGEESAFLDVPHRHMVRSPLPNEDLKIRYKMDV